MCFVTVVNGRREISGLLLSRIGNKLQNCCAYLPVKKQEIAYLLSGFDDVIFAISADFNEIIVFYQKKL